nr:MAG TPA: Head protein [Caudoviricetes sp.]
MITTVPIPRSMTYLKTNDQEGSIIMQTTPVVTPKQQLRPLTEFNNAQILNMIRNEASPEYQRRMPSATQMNMDRQMATLMSSTQLKNEFYSALVNRIGGTYVNTWRWNNPLAVFQRASQVYGDTWQEIAVGMPLAQVYDPDAEYLGADNFRKWKIDVDSLYHRLDFTHWYPATTEDRTLQRAFTSETGLASLTSQILTSCYNAAEVDLFEAMCHQFVEYAKLGGYWRVHMDKDLNNMGSSETDARNMLRQIRAWADTLKFVSTRYNARHMPTFARPDELVLFCSPEVKSALDVQGLATVFQRTDAEPTIDRIIVIPQDRFGMNGVQAILTTDKFLIDIPVISEMTQQINPVNINSVNHYLHVQHIISVSGFAPAVMFWTGAGSAANVVAPAGTAAKTPAFQLKLAMYGGGASTPSNVARGGAVQVVADTTITNDGAATFRSNAVEYHIGDTTKPKSDYTYISPTGVLVVGLDEPNTTIPITATALYTDPATPEVPGTVSAALNVPVVGDGVIGFNPSIIASIAVTVPEVTAGHTAQATATATMIDGRTADVTAQAAWTSDAPTHATVSESGVVTGVKAGSSNVTAALFGVSCRVTVTVA